MVIKREKLKGKKKKDKLTTIFQKKNCISVNIFQ